MSLNLAIAGATGAVGTQFINLLEKRNLPIGELRLLASARSKGKELTFKGNKIRVQELNKDAFAGIDITFFSAGAERSLEFAPASVNAGAVVIDNSSAFRLDPEIPLVIPECNPEDAFDHNGIIANPNCSTIQMVVALKPLHDAAIIKRVIVSTYQAVSGTGMAAMQELEQQVKDHTQGNPIRNHVYPKQIAFNVIPQCDIFMENSYTKEEMKMVYETQKILHAPAMKISATCVRVPVLRSHSESIHIETKKKLSEFQARKILSEGKGILILDEKKDGGYPTPIDCTGTFETYVGRIREDISVENGLAFWCVADQLYKGAALNAIQIAELLQKMGLLHKDILA